MAVHNLGTTIFYLRKYTATNAWLMALSSKLKAFLTNLSQEHYSSDPHQPFALRDLFPRISNLQAGV